MTVKEYLGTHGGRLVSFSMALAMLAGGISTVQGPGGGGTLILTALLSLSVTGFIGALVLTIGTAEKYVLLMICALPPLAGIYLALIHMWRGESNTLAAVVMLAIAAVAALLGVVMPNTEPEHAEEH